MNIGTMNYAKCINDTQGIISDPSMHPPGFKSAHCLPFAGIQTSNNPHLYRYNRIVDKYPPDPCIRPNEGDMICPPECGHEKRNDLMSPAGIPIPEERDIFKFYRTRRTYPEPQPMPICRCPQFQNGKPCSSLGPITNMITQCPCINRMDNQQGQGNHPNDQYTQTFGGQSLPANTQDGQFSNFDYSSNGMRPGAMAPTPNTMMSGAQMSGAQMAGAQMAGASLPGAPPGIGHKITSLGAPNYHCQNPYYPSDYVCRAVYDRKYLDDCPEQNGPHPDHYTFL